MSRQACGETLRGLANAEQTTNIMSYYTTSQFNLVKKLIADATGGEEAWDSEVLNMAVDACIAGTKAGEFEGRPTDSEEFSDFQKAWNKAQAEIPQPPFDQQVEKINFTSIMSACGEVYRAEFAGCWLELNSEKNHLQIVDEDSDQEEWELRGTDWIYTNGTNGQKPTFYWPESYVDLITEAIANL